MSIKSKKHSLVAAAAVVSLLMVLVTCATPAPPVEIQVHDNVLYRFVMFEDGTFGYDFGSPVPYHRFTDEICTQQTPVQGGMGCDGSQPRYASHGLP